MINLCNTCGCKGAESFEAENFIGDSKKRITLGKKMVKDAKGMQDYEYQWTNIEKAGQGLIEGNWKKFKGNVNQLDTSPRQVIKQIYGKSLSKMINPKKRNQIYLFDAESFEAETWGVQIYDTDLTMADVKKMLKEAGIKTKGSVRKIGNGYGYYFNFDSSHHSKFEKAFKKFGKAGNYEYEAESFEGEVPILGKGKEFKQQQPLLPQKVIDRLQEQGIIRDNLGGTFVGDFIAIRDSVGGYYKKGDKAKITILEEEADENYDEYDNYIGPLLYEITLVGGISLAADPVDFENNWRVVNEAEDDDYEREQRRISRAKDGFQCYRCNLWYDTKDEMNNCIKECKEYYNYNDAESFEGESPMMKNITAIGVLALAIIIGKKMKR